MRVNELLKRAHMKKVLFNHKVSSISSDSRRCKKNSIFVSIDGNKEYIIEAIKQGAKTILSKEKVEMNSSINWIQSTLPQKEYAILAQLFYAKKLKGIYLIGVIGTNGKTTVSSIGYHFFNFIQRPSMLIGSNGIYCRGYQKKTKNTTPDLMTIYEHLLYAKEHKIAYVFMEISSVAVDQYRTYGLQFTALIFTNFSQDHLDYHKTMAEYLYCKTVPFVKLNKNSYAVLNEDDDASLHIRRFCDAKIITYGCNKQADILGTLNYATKDGISFYVKGVLFKSKLIGIFNIYNALSILGLCDIFHISYIRYKEFLAKLLPIEGRMNQLTYKKRYIIIDYAHTYLATKKVIDEAKRLCVGNLTIVIGCGGNREKEKRGQIGTLLNETKARVILTIDNPRYEDPQAIIKDIQKNIDKPVEVCLDRKKAIECALERLKEGDYLLVLGKGCEDYIEYKGVKYPYSDLEVIHDWIRCH